MRGSMDGTSLTVLHDTDLSQPIGLTLDHETQSLYWVDYTLNKIEVSNSDGSGRSVLTTSSVRDPYSITFHNGKLYWTDIYYNRIYTTPVIAPSVTSIISQGDMYGIQAIAEERQPKGYIILLASIINFFAILIFNN